MTARSRRRRRNTNDALEDNGVARCMRLAFAVLAAYLLVSIIPLIRWSLATGRWAPPVVHAVVLASAIVLATRHRIPSQRLWLDWLPLAAGPYLYAELHWILIGTGRPRFDSRVVAWESHFFRSDPSATLAVRFHSIGLSEFLHFCYLTYYALIFLPPILLWIKGRRSEFAATMLALVVVYAACFCTWMAFPVDGPRYLHAPAAAPDGPFRTLVIVLLEAASSRGTAFPSSHVAAAIVASACAIRFLRISAVVVPVLTIGLAAGAVYGGYHYTIDVVAGGVVGVAAVLFSRAFEPSRIRFFMAADQTQLKYDVVAERLERRKTAVKDKTRDWRKYL